MTVSTWTDMTIDAAHAGEVGTTYDPRQGERFTKRFRGGEPVYRVTTYIQKGEGEVHTLTTAAFRKKATAELYFRDMNRGTA